MKQRYDPDLSAAIEKSCKGFLVNTIFCNDQAMCIAEGANFADFRLLQICHIILTRLINAGVKSNGIDNFTGNSLSHLATPTINIIAKS